MVAERAYFSGVLAVTALILGACGSGSDIAPVVTVTPTPVVGSPAASPSPDPVAEGPGPAPVMPELAKQNTPEGAAAFTTYWFELFNWSVGANDDAALRELSGSGCEYCNGLLDKISEGASSSVRLEGGGAEISNVTFAHEFSDGAMAFDIAYSEKAGRQVRPDGSTHHEWTALAPVSRQVAVEWQDGRGWVMGDFGARIECVDCAY